MTLSDQEYKEFIKTHLNLLHFVGKQQGIFGNITFKAFLKLGIDVKFQCRQAVIRDLNLIENYIHQHLEDLSVIDIEILNAFRWQKCGRFIIFKCLAKYAIFIDTSDNNFYTVKALSDRFDELFYKFPVIVSTCILPFKDKIIYDGFIETPVMYIGSTMANIFKTEYQKAKAKNKIRTSLIDKKNSK